MCNRIIAPSGLPFLATQKGQPSKLSKKHAYLFALDLLTLFGSRYAEDLKLNPKTRLFFDQAHRALVEIQKKLSQGQGNYVPEFYPKTFEVMQSLSESQNQLSVFLGLKEFSYSLLPFPQKVILYTNPELDTLKELERIHTRGLSLITEILSKPEKLADHKEDFPLPSGLAKDLSAADEVAVTKVYFRQGAIVYDRRIVYFSEMIHMWSTLSAANRLKHEQLLQKLTAREWVEDLPGPIEAFSIFEPSDRPEKWSFQHYLARCSIRSIKEKLGLKLSSPIKIKLAKEFADLEQARSDLCYFSALPVFYELDIARYERSSTHLIQTFQLFFFLTRNFDMPEEERPALLNILVYRDSSWSQEMLPSFIARTWNQSPIDPDEVAAFKDSWKRLKEILTFVKKPPASFSNTAEVSLLSNPVCWNLLFFLWKHPQRKVFVKTLSSLAELPRFSMTLPSAMEFCLCNKEDLLPISSELFLEAYKAVIQTLEERVEHTESLFFDPPHALQSCNVTVYGFAPGRTKIFVEKMASYPFFSKEKEYCQMLRMYILYPQPWLFERIKDCEAIGAEITEDFLYKVLSQRQDVQEGFLQPQIRGAAIAIAKQIQEKNLLSGVQIFSVYCELLRLVREEKADCLEKIFQAVDQLTLFCASLSQETRCFFFRYHPEMIDLDQLAQIREMRENWSQNAAQLHRLVIDQVLYQEIMTEIEGFAALLSKACPDSEIAAQFSVTLQMELLSTFFPYLQPLSNFFRISNLTPEGIQWGEPVWKTHEGQLTPLKHTKLGVYLHWSIYHDRPVLFMSFVNMETGKAISSFLPLMVSYQSIAPREKRIPFYGLLARLAQTALKEASDSNVPNDAPEEPTSWIPAYTGLKELIGDFPDVDAAHVAQMWNFIKRVKVAYRKNYLLALTDLPPSDLPNDPLRIAALGHIFTSHPRGSLLPELPPNHPEHFTPEHFTPEASEEFVAPCRDLFDLATHNPQPLNLNLKTVDGEFPISYHVQTVDEFVGENVQGKKNENAAPINERTGKYVTLKIDGIKIPLRYPPEVFSDPTKFQRHFYGHVLRLKAAYYFTKSLE